MNKAIIVFAVLFALASASSSSSSSSKSSSSSVSSSSEEEIKKSYAYIFPDNVGPDADEIGGIAYKVDLTTGEIYDEVISFPFDGIEGVDYVDGFGVWFSTVVVDHIGVLNFETGAVRSFDIFPAQGQLEYGDLTGSCEGYIWITTIAEDDFTPEGGYPLFQLNPFGWLTVLTRTPFRLKAITYDEQEKLLYVISADGGVNLYTVDPASGNVTVVGAISAELASDLTQPANPAGLSIDYNGNLWLVESQWGEDSADLWLINKTTGEATLKQNLEIGAGSSVIAVEHGCPAVEPEVNSKDGSNKGDKPAKKPAKQPAKKTSQFKAFLDEQKAVKQTEKSSNVVIIVASVCSAFAAFALIIGFVVYRRRNNAELVRLL